MSMNNNSNQQNLCKQGCGFYGNAQNMDMCSKCYENFLKTSSNQEEAPHSQSANQLSPYGSSQISINDIYQPHQTSTTTSTDKSNVIHSSQHRKRQIAQSFLMEYSGGHKVPKSCKLDSKQCNHLLLYILYPINHSWIRNLIIYTIIVLGPKFSNSFYAFMIY